MNPPLSLDESAIYQIRLQGAVDQSWAREVGMHINNSVNSGSAPVATLIGEVADQAALFGVLNRMYGLGYPLLSVTCLFPPMIVEEGSDGIE